MLKHDQFAGWREPPELPEGPPEVPLLGALAEINTLSLPDPLPGRKLRSSTSITKHSTSTLTLEVHLRNEGERGETLALEQGWFALSGECGVRKVLIRMHLESRTRNPLYFADVGPGRSL